MDIVFNINNLALEGLGATLVSLVKNCTDSKELKIWFLCSGFNRVDKKNINHLLADTGFKGSKEFIDFDAEKIFGHLNSLHGDWTAYGRLLIADYIKTDRVLYLDADLLIYLDILTLNNIDLDGVYFAAESGSTVEWALEGSFFINKLNWPKDRAYFNSGVMLFNLKKWRADNLDAKWKSIAKAYPDDLISHDQTLLNAIGDGNFIKLPSNFNSAWFAKSEKPADANYAIIHFVGSPKPWDLFGKKIHKGYSSWKKYHTHFWEKNYGKISAKKFKRTWKIRRSIIKQLINGIK